MTEGTRSYYDDKLSAERLKMCYEIATPRVKRYLEAELNHVLCSVHSGDSVLELGCGYGRILPQLAGKAKLVIGIDISFASLQLGRKMMGGIPNCLLLQMDAAELAFRSRVFDLVVCIQNGISAFRVDWNDLIRESIRVTRLGGTAVFSSYSDKFWKDRIEWFQLQSEAGLLGEIDYERTRNGDIICKDGFIATTVTQEQFMDLTSGLDADVSVVEVDESSLFCEIKPV